MAGAGKGVLFGLRRRRAGVVGRCGVVAVLLLSAGLMPSPGPPHAQTLPGCTAATRDDPPREVLDCGNGLVIEREAAAALDAATPQTSLDLTDRAVLIEVSPRDSFQVLTPHAIATVRGTRFVVDVQGAETSVFVIKGQVEVERRRGPESVLLGPGEGVDVGEGAPLVVRRWPQPRVAALLARFGR
ncbi:FecR domain-containing protein [Jiella sonneratiae]|uniref:FecR domain-containing protein n=1 Tax=Jiella sonneratiae TaxID=2816856 RepID=A0ABS3IXN4_9HYPH|nr:FecR family protein [Jiella sonneratiae]MBO0902154.1 FecR domain-containing protein [Jiella sonneratiae]